MDSDKMKPKNEINPVRIILVTALVVALLFGSVVSVLAFFNIEMVKDDYQYQLYLKEKEKSNIYNVIEELIPECDNELNTIFKDSQGKIYVYQSCTPEQWLTKMKDVWAWSFLPSWYPLSVVHNFHIILGDHIIFFRSLEYETTWNNSYRKSK